MKIKYKHEIKSNEKLSENKLVEILLKNRQIKKPKEFITPTHPLKIKLTDFGYKRELKKTLKQLEKIKKNNEMIVVYTDYDADGITGGAILWETLYFLGFKTMPYVPHRKKEGYGFSIKGIDNVKKQSTINNQQLTINFQTDYLALASIGSIADLVPLTGPTRSVVKYGLEAFTSIKRAGIKHLIDQAGITGKKITPYEVGFIIALRINAVGRLEHAIDALRLLCTTNNEKAFNLASRVGTTNKERQDMVVKAVEQAKQLIN